MNNKSFFEPIITLLGIIASLAVSLAPLFNQTQIDKFFLDKSLIVPSSTLAFILSTIAVWMGLTQPYINFPYFMKEPWKTISNKINDYFRSTIAFGFTILTVLVFIFSKFMDLAKSGKPELAIQQSVLYIVFFIVTGYLFAILFKQSKSKYEFDQRRQEFPNKVRNLLESHGQIENNFKIIDIYNFDYMTKLVHITLEKTQKKDVYVIINNDASELFRTLTKTQGEGVLNPPQTSQTPQQPR